MSETYQSKRERWQRLLESLPTVLREHVSLRNVEAVAALTPPAQEQLAAAIQAGLKRIPRAIEQLRTNPNISVADLINPPAQFVAGPPQLASDSPQHIQKQLADLIQGCFPDMPRVSAEALAEAEVMDVARRVAQAHDQLFQSNHVRTDFVMMVLYGLMRQTLERLEEIIEDTPALRQAFDQGGLPWKTNTRRKQHA